MTDYLPAGSDSPSGRPRPSLLIADDDPVVLSMISTQLTANFDIVAYARDSEEAIARAFEHQPDVAILDVEMPCGGGLRAAQGLHERTLATAIVAFSGDESDSMVRAIVAAGAVTYVRKGISGAELVRTLYQAIETHAQLGGRARTEATGARREEYVVDDDDGSDHQIDGPAPADAVPVKEFRLLQDPIWDFVGGRLLARSLTTALPGRILQAIRNE
jgi:CheY-like chemotaxis protein